MKELNYMLNKPRNIVHGLPSQHPRWTTSMTLSEQQTQMQKPDSLLQDSLLRLELFKS